MGAGLVEDAVHADVAGLAPATPSEQAAAAERELATERTSASSELVLQTERVSVRAPGFPKTPRKKDQLHQLCVAYVPHGNFPDVDISGRFFWVFFLREKPAETSVINY